MTSDTVPAPQVALQEAIRTVTGIDDLDIDNLVLFYQDKYGHYGTLSSCCCGTHRVALMAAGMYNLDDMPMAGQVLANG